MNGIIKKNSFVQHVVRICDRNRLKTLASLSPKSLLACWNCEFKLEPTFGQQDPSSHGSSDWLQNKYVWYKKEWKHVFMEALCWNITSALLLLCFCQQMRTWSEQCSELSPWETKSCWAQSGEVWGCSTALIHISTAHLMLIQPLFCWLHHSGTALLQCDRFVKSGLISAGWLQVILYLKNGKRKESLMLFSKIGLILLDENTEWVTLLHGCV